MRLTYTSDLSKAIASLRQMQNLPQNVGQRWVKDCAAHFREQLIANLESQGRGGNSPPLAEVTKQIYAQQGEPDGSAIVEHIGITITNFGHTWQATVGIKAGRPTMIAQVQDKGAAIEVTEAMRGFLAAAHGIYLRQDTTHIYIPGRRFWRLSYGSTKKFAAKRLKKLCRKH